MGSHLLVWDWLKFKPIIEEYRKTELGPNAFINFEYLAEAVLRVKERSEPYARARYARVEKEYQLDQ